VRFSPEAREVERIMNGVITSRDVVSNFRIIWREFGFKCLMRCVWCSIDPHKNTTFLEIAFRK